MKNLRFIWDCYIWFAKQIASLKTELVYYNKKGREIHLSSVDFHTSMDAIYSELILPAGRTRQCRVLRCLFLTQYFQKLLHNQIWLFAASGSIVMFDKTDTGIYKLLIKVTIEQFSRDQ